MAVAGSFDVHPDMTVLMEASKAQPPATTIAEQRRNWTNYTAVTRRPPPSDMKVADKTLQVPGHPVPVRVYTPAGLSSAAPCIVYIHGGGFMKGDLDSSDSVAWGFAALCGAVVVSVDYRLSPEHPYPAAFDDCFNTVAYIAGNAAEFGIDPTRLAVAGDSAGGNLTAAVCHAARDRGGPAIVAQALIYPCVGVQLELDSYKRNGDAPGLQTTSMKWYWEMYLAGRNGIADKYAAPLTDTDFTGLPPTLVHIAEFDPLADDGLVYAGRLKAAGVPTEYRVAKRMIHGFMRARFEGTDSPGEFQAICTFLKKHLG